MTNQTKRTNLGGKYLTFRVADEQYGVGILNVREIISLLPITPIPQSPPYVLGVINLRGRVTSVADLRSRFGMPSVEPTPESCVIIVEVDRDGETVTMGLLVDEVAEVTDIDEGSTSPPPRFHSGIEPSLLLGIGRIDERVVLLLDIDEVLRQPAHAEDLQPR